MCHRNSSRIESSGLSRLEANERKIKDDVLLLLGTAAPEIIPQLGGSRQQRTVPRGREFGNDLAEVWLGKPHEVELSTFTS